MKRKLIKRAKLFFFSRYYLCILAILLILWGIGICLFYGRIGFMPLDQSIAFDGAWRIISGQLPFRDFATPCGLTPILLQVPFFKIFGLNWFAYCLHAAIFNGIFSLLVFLLLKWLGGSDFISLSYAFLSAIIFYPPFGTPYLDQHAFFFVLLALVITMFSYKIQVFHLKFLGWLALPPVLLTAFFSKQLVAVLAAPVVLAALLATTKKDHLKIMFIALIISVIFIGSFFIANYQIFTLDLGLFKEFILHFPSRVGIERFKVFVDEFSLLKKLAAIFYPHSSDKSRLIFFSVFLINLSVLTALTIIILFYLKKRLSSLPGQIFLKIFLSLSLLMMSNLFVLLTLNLRENGLPFLFTSLGLMHIVSLNLYPKFISLKKKIIFKNVISILFIFVALLDGINFNNNVNRTRLIHDFLMGEKLQTSSNELPEELEFIKFATPHVYNFTPKALKRVIDFFKKSKENFFLIGDASILYGLARRPSVNPVLWFHPELTIPRLDSEDFQLYENWVLENIKKYKVRYLVLEGDYTWFKVSLANFNKLQQLVIENSKENRSFGAFKILRIDDRKLIQNVITSNYHRNKKKR